MSPKVSVIIPVYNVEPYLRQCLDSVVNQTMREIEIICVNDGSTDGSLAILEEYAAQDERITVISQENGGLNAARNAGLKRVNGEYIAIVDSDDWVELSLCKRVYAVAKDTDAEVVMFLFNQIKGLQLQKPDPYKISWLYKYSADDKLHTLFTNPPNCWSRLWKTSLIQNNQIKFPEDLVVGEELPFVVEAILRANKMVFLPQALYNYRIRGGSIMGDRSHPRYLQYAQAFNQTIEMARRLPISQDLIHYLYEVKVCTLYYTWPSIAKSLKKRYARAIWNNITEEEYILLVNNRLPISAIIKYFMLQGKGSFCSRNWSYIKYLKAFFADWLAKKLVPHSSFIQQLLDTNKEQRGTIQRLQEHLYNSDKKL